jgi:histone-lysine N-methyltransferase SETMAR
MLRTVVERLHNNGRPHSATHIVESLHQLNLEVLKHPPYSPGLAFSDYHLFGPLRDTLRDRHFTSDQELKEAVRAWLVTQRKTFLSAGIQKLLDCWTEYVEKGWGCIEKLHCSTYSL